MTDEKTAEAAAANAVQEAEKEENMIITLSNGVKVRVKPLPDLLLRKLYTQYEAPEPPEVEVTSGGKTWTEPNPDDPAYQDAMRRYTMNIANGVVNLHLLKGFDIIETPDDIPEYEEDDTWEDELAAIGIDIPDNPLQKRLAWIEYRIVASNSDMDKIQEASQKLSGVTEEDVAAAQEQFRGITGGVSGRGVDNE